MKGGEFFGQLLYPAACVGCGLWYAHDPDAWWCSRCEAERLRGKCLLSKTVAGVTVFSAHTLASAPIRRAIHEIKYGCVYAAACCAARWLAPIVPQIVADGPVVFVPVPLHHTRFAERGFNQSEIIARHLMTAVVRGTLDTELLVRLKRTKPQALSDFTDRTQQMSGAFAAQRRCDPRTQYILIDDVVTSGATLAACINAMRAAGAARISGLTVATAAD